MRHDATKLNFSVATLFDEPVLFTDLRVDRATVPPQFHLYEIRHEGEDWGRPCQLAKGILVNFYGTVLTLDPLELPEDGYLSMDAEDLSYPDAIADVSLDSFLRTYSASIEEVLL